MIRLELHTGGVGSIFDHTEELDYEVAEGRIRVSILHGGLKDIPTDGSQLEIIVRNPEISVALDLSLKGGAEDPVRLELTGKLPSPLLYRRTGHGNENVLTDEQPQT